MTSKQNVAAALLLVLLAGALYGVYDTGTERVAPRAVGARFVSSDSSLNVDQSSLVAAEALVRLPTTADERPFAEDALRLGDQEMDLAFAQAIRDAVDRPPATTPEASAITARLGDARKRLAADQGDVARLSAAPATADAANGTPIADQRDLAQAQLALDQDEVDDASQDLMRVGGDPAGRMQAMTEEHNAASKSSDSTRVNVTLPTEARGIVHAAQAVRELRHKALLLRRAREAAESLAVVFGTRHARLDSAASASRDAASGAAAHRALSHQAAAALLLDTRRRAIDSKTKAGLDQRGDDQRRLADIYTRWADVVSEQERDAANRALRGLAFIFTILLLGVFIDKWIEHLLGTTSMDRRYVHTLCIVTRVSLQVIGVLIVLLVVFGPPANLGTVLGLAGAGLTVALKDFIIGFFGWFVLMGKNGIRIGDLVEINGVTGEVVELGMFHTMLLETGSWSDSGHPTGRRVRFTNSFAIEGHYINFSAAGQWLWDEVQIVVPSDHDPFSIAEVMRTKVEAETAATARIVEEQWKGLRRSPRSSGVTAAPTINIKPIIGGFEITVRYIAQAAERSELRATLYRVAVGLLGGPPASGAPSAPRPAEPSGGS